MGSFKGLFPNLLYLEGKWEKIGLSTGSKKSLKVKLLHFNYGLIYILNKIMNLRGLGKKGKWV